MAHYYVVAERGSGRTWWLSFPHGAGIFSAADDAANIPAQARDALESASDDFDMVVSDIGLPDGSGFEVSHTLRGALRHRGRVRHLLSFCVLFLLCDNRLGLPLRIGFVDCAEGFGT